MSTRTVRNDIERLRGLGYPVHAHARLDRRLSARSRSRPAAAPPRRRRGHRGGRRTADGRRRARSAGSRRHRCERWQARASDADPDFVARSTRCKRSRSSSRATSANRPSMPIVLTRSPPPAAITIRSGSRIATATGDSTPRGRAVSARELGPSLVPGRVGPRREPIGGRSGSIDWRSSDAARPAVHSAAVTRRGHRRLRGPRGRHVRRWRYRARIVVHAPADAIAERIGRVRRAPIEPIDAGSCVVDAGADSLETLAVYLGHARR